MVIPQGGQRGGFLFCRRRAAVWELVFTQSKIFDLNAERQGNEEMNSIFVLKAMGSHVEGLLRGLTFDDMYKSVHDEIVKNKGEKLSYQDFQYVLGRAQKLMEERETQSKRFIIREKPDENGDYTIIDTDTGEIITDVIRCPKPRQWELGHYEYFDEPQKDNKKSTKPKKKNMSKAKRKTLWE